MLGLSSMYISLFENSINNFIDDIKMNIGNIGIAEIVDYKTTALDNRVTVELLKKVRDVKFTVHCPFEAAYNISNPKEEDRKLAIAKLKLSMDKAAEIGAIGFVLHPGSKLFAYHKDANGFNDEGLLQLVDYGKSLGMKIGIENMPPNVGFLSTPEEFDDFIRDNNLQVDLVFDTGHANIAGNVDDFVQKYASRFMQIHVTDNDGKSDSHRNVGEGTVDWKKLVADLREKGFKGAYVIESVVEPLKSIATLKQLM